MGQRVLQVMGVGVAVLLLASAALAATGEVRADAGALDAGVQPVASGSAAPRDALPTSLASAAEEDEGVLDRGAEGLDRGADVEHGRDGRDRRGFGAVRSVEARAFGACMRDSGGGREAREGCAHLRPGPAHRNPAHPGRGPDGDRGEGRGPRGDRDAKGRGPGAQGG